MKRMYVLSALMFCSLITPVIHATDETAELIKVVTRDAKTNVERAEKLLGASETLADNPDVRKGFLLKALEYAETDPKGSDVAMKIIAELEKLGFLSKGELLEKQQAMLEKQYALSKGNDRMSIAGRLLAMSEQAGDALLEDGKATAAFDMYTKARRYASALKQTVKVRELSDKMKGAQKRQQVELKVAGLEKRLKESPDDVSARTQLILLKVVEMDDPAAAAKLLTKDIDDETRICVESAARSPDQLTVDDCSGLADWYKKLSETAGQEAKISTLLHARGYYKQMLGTEGLSGMTALKTKVSLKQVEDKLKSLGYAPPGELPLKKWTDIGKLLKPDMPHLYGKIEKKGIVTIFHPAPGEWPSGRLQIPVELTGSYDLQCQLQWGADWHGCRFGLPLGPNKYTIFEFGGHRSSFSGVDGIATWEENYPCRIRTPKLRAGMTYTIEVNVRIKAGKVALLATVNKAPLLKWESELKRMSGRPHSRGPNALGIGTGNQPTAYSNFRVRVLDGEGRLLKQEK